MANEDHLYGIELEPLGFRVQVSGVPIWVPCILQRGGRGRQWSARTDSTVPRQSLAQLASWQQWGMRAASSSWRHEHRWWSNYILYPCAYLHIWTTAHHPLATHTMLHVTAKHVLDAGCLATVPCIMHVLVMFIRLNMHTCSKCIPPSMHHITACSVLYYVVSMQL